MGKKVMGKKVMGKKVMGELKVGLASNREEKFRPQANFRPSGGKGGNCIALYTQ